MQDSRIQIVTSLVGILYLTIVVIPAIADDQSSQENRVTQSGLRGIHRLGMPLGTAPELTVAGTAGYGYIESLGPVKGAHHSLEGTVGVGATMIPQLSFGLHLSGRYDKHPDDDRGKDSSLIGNPYLTVRGGFEAVDWLDVGAELGVWIPGSEAPSLVWNATTLSTSLLFGITPKNSPWVLSLKGGFRLDNSAKAAPNPETTRYGDRISTRLSDFNSILAGLGGAYRFSAVEIFGEITADLLIGSGAPTSASPMRAAIGLDYHATDSLALGLLAEAALSKRPGVLHTDPLVPIEPRFAVTLGISYAFNFAEAPPPPPPVVEPEPEKVEPVEPVIDPPKTTTISGQLLDQQRSPAVGVGVRLEAGEKVDRTETDNDGQYLFEEVPLGKAELSTESDNFESLRWTVDVEVGMAKILPRELVTRVTGSQLRGLVRSFGGEGIAATIHIRPSQIKIETEPDGSFQIDLEPGVYTVRITARGYKKQKKRVVVEKDSVYILNVDLRRNKR